MFEGLIQCYKHRVTFLKQILQNLRFTDAKLLLYNHRKFDSEKNLSGS
jgi:hypothetical protein